MSEIDVWQHLGLTPNVDRYGDKCYHDDFCNFCKLCHICSGCNELCEIHTTIAICKCVCNYVEDLA